MKSAAISNGAANLLATVSRAQGNARNNVPEVDFSAVMNQAGFQNQAGLGNREILQGASAKRPEKDVDTDRSFRQAKRTEDADGTFEKTVEKQETGLKADTASASEERAADVKTDDAVSPAEVSEEVLSKVSEFLDKVQRTLQDGFSMTEEELLSAMEELGFTMADFLNPDTANACIQALSGAQDSMALLVDEQLYTVCTRTQKEVMALTEAFGEEVSLTGEELELVLSKLEEQQTQSAPEETRTDFVSAEASEETGTDFIPAEASEEARTDFIPVEASEETGTDFIPAETSEEVPAGDMAEAGRADGPDEAESPIAGKNPEVLVVSRDNSRDKAESVRNEAVDETRGEPAEKTEVKQTAEPLRERGQESGTKEQSQPESQSQFESQSQSGNRSLLENQNQLESQLASQGQPELQTAGPEAANVVDADMAFTSYTSYDGSYESIIRQVAEQIRVQVTADSSSMEMQLHPENLGKLELSVELRQGALTARFAAENEQVKEAIESQAAVLREDLNRQGVRVEAIEVTVQAHEFERNLEQGQQQSQSEEEAKRAQRPRNGRRNLNLDDLEEEEELTEAEDLAARMMRENGNTMDYFA